MKALVIGGSSAIGTAVVQQLAAQGYDIDFTYHSNADKATSLQQSLGVPCNAIALDLSDTAAVDAFCQSLDATNAPDVLVNVAGITHDALSVGQIGPSLRRVMTVNFAAPATICGRVAELMMPRRRGAIVNVTSVASRLPRAGNAAYGSAKAALERFTASLTLEVARFKVRTLCVAPAFVDTPMFRQFAAGHENDIIRSVPLREILSVDDVANTVSAFVRGDIRTTGITLALTNGQPMF